MGFEKRPLADHLFYEPPSSSSFSCFTVSRSAPLDLRHFGDAALRVGHRRFEAVATMKPRLLEDGAASADHSLGHGVSFQPKVLERTGTPL